MPSLYNLTEDYAGLITLAESDEVDAKTIADTIEGLEGEAADKIANTIKVIKNSDILAKGAAQEIKRLQEFKKARENEVERLRDGILLYMQIAEIDKLKTHIGTTSRQQGREQAHYNDEGFETTLDAKYIEYLPKVDKSTLLKDLKALKEGETIKGADLVRGEESLVIR